ncbi:MAG: hypothetical protein CR993_00315 [Rhodobacterales bacterium]|nr:MAG: hypothetical protein CR993_00315 [Rhodobacterales bacterium]
MTISKDLFLSILAMDAYNRGYDSGISEGKHVENDVDLGLGDIKGIKIGAAEVGVRASSDPDGVERGNSFYALSYEITGANAPEGLAGKTVISFRGTDTKVSDIWTGWTVGAGWAGEPGSMLSGASQAGQNRISSHGFSRSARA